MGSNMHGEEQWEMIRVLDKFLAEPLGAELYFFLTFRKNKGITSDMWEYFQTSWRMRGHTMDLLGPKHLESLKQQLEDGHAENKTWLPQMFQEASTATPYKWYFIVQQWARCLDGIRAAEKDEGFAYRYVLFTRLDLLWLAPHPPLSAIEPTRCAGRDTVWVLEGEEYAGVNDRYLLAERPAADFVSGLWETFSSFRGVDEVERFLQSHGTPGFAISLGRACAGFASARAWGGVTKVNDLLRPVCTSLESAKRAQGAETTGWLAPDQVPRVESAPAPAQACGPIPREARARSGTCCTRSCSRATACSASPRSHRWYTAGHIYIYIHMHIHIHL